MHCRRGTDRPVPEASSCRRVNIRKISSLINRIAIIGCGQFLNLPFVKYALGHFPFGIREDGRFVRVALIPALSGGFDYIITCRVSGALACH
jgi:hypothetical protein